MGHKIDRRLPKWDQRRIIANNNQLRARAIGKKRNKLKRLCVAFRKNKPVAEYAFKLFFTADNPAYCNFYGFCIQRDFFGAALKVTRLSGH